MNIIDGTDFRTLGFLHGILALLFTPFLLKTYNFSNLLSQPLKVLSKVLFVFFMLLLPIGTLLILLSFLGSTHLEYFGVLFFVVGMAPIIKILKNRDHVGKSMRVLGYVEIVIASILLVVGIIGYGQSGWFIITYLVGSWDSIPIWTGLFRLLILLIVCVVVSRFIK